MTGDLLVFSDESSEEINKTKNEKWKIIIADDEEEVHVMTKMVMKKFTFENRGIELLCAYSGEETKKLMNEHKDIAVILLDVVMETENSGLEVVKYIREELGNPFVRIILRTGQPGQAPQDDVIRNYDINDYKSKTELTVQKLYTSVIASIRAFTDMKLIDNNRKGLELVLTKSRELFTIKDVDAFSRDILLKYAEILNINNDNSFVEGYTLLKHEGKFITVASLKNNEFGVESLDEEIDPNLTSGIKEAINLENNVFRGNYFISYFNTSDKVVKLIIIKSKYLYKEIDINLFRIFTSNVAVAFDNLYLNKEIIDTQKEVIITLGELVETRSKETANHVIRVAEYSYILAKEYGLDEDTASILRLASPMHDIGKIGIPDLILNKPGKLTDDEFELIKSHTTIGYDVLKRSTREIMKTAATIALEHHERWNGKGYPNGLQGEEINILSRITSIADVYDALSHKRVYKKAWTHESVVEYISDEKGQMFDPKIVDLFLANIEKIVNVKERYPDED